MSAVTPRFSRRLAVLFFVGSVAVEMANAQDGRTDTRGSFGVPLQPFSLRETADTGPRAEPIRVAYYAPRSQPALAPRAESVEDDLERTNTFPEINSNRPMVAGDRAILRNAIAYAPSHAPDNIKNAIWAVNTWRRWTALVCGWPGHTWLQCASPCRLVGRLFPRRPNPKRHAGAIIITA